MDKSHVLLDGIGVGKKAVGAKPAQKKVTVKPKAQEVIEISPDTEEDVKAKKQEVGPVNKKKEGEVASSKKKSQTLTSVLTARSKVSFDSFFVVGCSESILFLVCLF